MSVAKNGTELKSGTDVVVRTLEERGVTHVFGVPGGGANLSGDYRFRATAKRLPEEERTALARRTAEPSNSLVKTKPSRSSRSASKRGPRPI